MRARVENLHQIQPKITMESMAKQLIEEFFNFYGNVGPITELKIEDLKKSERFNQIHKQLVVSSKNSFQQKIFHPFFFFRTGTGDSVKHPHSLTIWKLALIGASGCVLGKIPQFVCFFSLFVCSHFELKNRMFTWTAMMESSLM